MLLSFIGYMCVHQMVQYSSFEKSNKKYIMQEGLSINITYKK